MPRTASPPESPARRRAREQLLLLLALLALAGCGREEVLHGLEEPAANEVVVALDEAGVRADKRREDGTDERWAVSVASSEASRAQRVLAERELPRPRAPGFGEVFGKGSLVPTATEERALYLHALAGELARSVEAVDGVVAARVHLAVPSPDPLRPTPGPPPRAALLVKTRPGARGRIEPLTPGLQQLVAGAVTGLEPAAVAVVVTEASATGAASAATPGPRRTVLLALAAAGALGACGIALWPLRGRVSAWLAPRVPGGAR